MSVALEWVGWGLLLIGSSFAVIGGLGLVRLPDFYTRLHGAGLTDTLGAGCVLAGLMFYAHSWLVVVKLLMILFVLLITSPTSAHALCRSARAQGLEPLIGEDRP
jgi:multicomponent Na+:H+ antiporter subunit G